jgi:hypothetical protein
VETQRYPYADNGNRLLGVILLGILTVVLVIGCFIHVGDSTLTVRFLMAICEGAHAIKG